MDAITRGKPLKDVVVDSAKIRLFAEAFGVSLRELAKLMGCDHAYLLRVLRAKQRISARYLTKLLEVLQQLARSRTLSPFTFVREIPSSPSVPATTEPLIPASAHPLIPEAGTALVQAS